jgi:hypothetical protein
MNLHANAALSLKGRREPDVGQGACAQVVKGAPIVQ